MLLYDDSKFKIIRPMVQRSVWEVCSASSDVVLYRIHGENDTFWVEQVPLNLSENHDVVLYQSAYQFTQRFCRQLEKEQSGEYVAISLPGLLRK